MSIHEASTSCPNCDGRKCMGCVFRVYDHDCADDCPHCCADTLAAAAAVIVANHTAAIAAVLETHTYWDLFDRCQCGQDELWAWNDWANHAAGQIAALDTTT